MATMKISLPDELQAVVDQQVPEHASGSGSECLQALIRRQRDVQLLRGVLMDGANSGPAIAMGAEVFQTLRARAHAWAADV
ncbi:CopG family transcriptional regulator [Xanthomonas pisi DSM 18956]|uniref:Antitoxin ParD n=1 Tax=Xanthomonas pisi TaxID=56457 RepID=A0A2S7D8C8_9XANT|nr:CopG family transcriptional regulator [Xanthomonas pisi]KLD71789.1 CopG family transcriptional regulator [Xanthomonas pisi DSM 18956]PPU70080.1 CopG family transcriptional regulator [Xanthomonas pisi]